MKSVLQAPTLERTIFNLSYVSSIADIPATVLPSEMHSNAKRTPSSPSNFRACIFQFAL